MLITKDKFKTEVKEHMREGSGSVVCTGMLGGASVPHLRLFATLTLEPGCSIGEHIHEREAEAFYVIDGCGSIIDDGVKLPFCKGEAHICCAGHKHSLVNDGNETFTVLAAIVTE